MPPPDHLDDQLEERASEILDQVTLHHFTATPETINPFALSVLSWRVDGPSGFQVRINIVRVAKAGTRSVQPRFTTTFQLHAYVGDYSKTLGTTTVTVNLARCISHDSEIVDDVCPEAR